MRNADWALRKDSINGGTEFCGDAGVIKKYGNSLFFGLIDGLGHGRKAHKAASLSEDYLNEHYTKPLDELLKGLHEILIGTAGAVAGIGRFELDTGNLTYAGIGNITARIYGNSSHSLISRDGVIGYTIPNPRLEESRLFPGDLLILTSDGISEHFLPGNFPGLLEGQARDIAGKFLKALRKDDDASCLVLRYL